MTIRELLHRMRCIKSSQLHEVRDGIIYPTLLALSKLTSILHPWHQREGSRLPRASKCRQTGKKSHDCYINLLIMVLDQYIFSSCSTITIYQVRLTHSAKENLLRCQELYLICSFLKYLYTSIKYTLRHYL